MSSLFSYLWTTYGMYVVIFITLFLAIRAWKDKKYGEMVVVLIVGVFVWFYGNGPQAVMNFFSQIFSHWIH